MAVETNAILGRKLWNMGNPETRQRFCADPQVFDFKRRMRPAWAILTKPRFAGNEMAVGAVSSEPVSGISLINWENTGKILLLIFDLWQSQVDSIKEFVSRPASNAKLTGNFVSVIREFPSGGAGKVFLAPGDWPKICKAKYVAMSGDFN